MDYKIHVNKTDGSSTIIHDGMKLNIPENIAENHTNLTLAMIEEGTYYELYSMLEKEGEALWKEIKNV